MRVARLIFRERRTPFALPALSSVLFALLLNACASLPPAQERSAAEVRRMADRTAQIYALAPIHLLVSRNPDDPPGSYRRGYFTVSSITLMSTFRDAIVAHELGHYVLGHEAPLHGDSSAEMERDYQQRELDANAKAVEILIRAGNYTQARALKTMYDYLIGVQWALERHPSLDLRGHLPPCDEISDLLARFPQQRGWTSTLGCVPEGVGRG